MIKVDRKTTIQHSTWDELVVETYGKPYRFQQQNGCRGRELFRIEVPCDYADDYDDNDFKRGGMGVSFESWLARDPEEPFNNRDRGSTYTIWERRFYPDVETLANDLHAKGLIEAGEYYIQIDW